MGRMRLALFTILVGGGVALGALLLVARTNTPLGRTLAPLFSLVGKGTKTVDRALSRVLPIGDVDERVLGDALASRMQAQHGTSDPRHAYLNALVGELTQGTQKPFIYRAFVAKGSPNAFALPGGVVLVTDGMMDMLDTEAELASVLGHEIGHVELGHCFDAVRFELLDSKLGGRTLGEIADFVYGALAHASFSKTQEEESDRYGFEALLAHGYDPAGSAGAFEKLALASGAAGRTARGVDPFRDYFKSHPPLELRIENLRERAKRWRERNAGTPVYVGRENLRQLVTKGQRAFPQEVLP